MKTRSLFALAALALVASAPSHADSRKAEVVQGVASVIDGDTLEVHGRRIRLHGIDAPESGQHCFVEATKAWAPCGRISAFALDEFVRGQTVRCEKRDRDSYDRMVGECFARGESVNAFQVRYGQAIAATFYSKAFVGHEAQAKAKGLGVWKTRFVEPYLWRKGERLPGEPNTKASYGVRR